MQLEEEISLTGNSVDINVITLSCPLLSTDQHVLGPLLTAMVAPSKRLGTRPLRSGESRGHAFLIHSNVRFE